MALTRAMLKGMGLTEEQISAIIDEHTSVTTALKDQIKEYKGYEEDAKKLPGVQKELDDLKKTIADNDWEGKYNKEHEAFENYKTDIAGKEKSAKIKDAYKKLLAECRVGDKHVDSILRVTDFKDMKLADDGTLENADKLKESISAEWSGFISTEGTQGAGVETPPASGNPNGGSSSRAAELAAKYTSNLYGTKSKEE